MVGYIGYAEIHNYLFLILHNDRICQDDSGRSRNMWFWYGPFLLTPLLAIKDGLKLGVLTRRFAAL